MCCGLSPRGLLILISCWAIFQSIIYLVFSVIGILISNGNYSMKDYKFNYLLYLAYFRDGTDSPIDWTVLGLPQPTIEIIQPDITAVVSRTGDFLYAYLVLSCAWIISSMSLIVATFTPCMSLLCLKVFSFPWVVTCIGILVMDVVATVFHIIDITNTTTTEDFLNFLEISNARELAEHLGAIPQYLLPLPSVTMMLVSIRLVLLWAINLSCLFCVIRGVRKMLHNELMKKSKALRPDFGYERELEFNNRRPDVNSPNSIEEPASQMSEIPRYNDTSVINQYQYDNNGYTAEPISQHIQLHHHQQPPQQQQPQLLPPNYVFVSEKRYLEPLKGGIGPRSEDGMSVMSSRLSNPRSLDSVDDVSRDSLNIGTRSQASSVDPALDYDNEIISPNERLSYDSMFSDNRRTQNGRSKADEPPPVMVKPSMIKQQVQQQQQQQQEHPQYMRQHQQIREEDLKARTSHQPTPDELRSQLPWSYFQDPTEPQRPQRQRHEDELLPPVPVPDYTLHFPKRERPPTKPKPKNPTPLPQDNNNNNERWSGPEYTY